MIMEQALEKIGEINWTEIEGAKLIKLDPSVPYIISLPKNTGIQEAERITAFFGQANIHATIIVGDPKDFKIFGSFPWFVQPREVIKLENVNSTTCKFDEQAKTAVGDGMAYTPKPKKKSTTKKVVKKSK